MGPSPLLDFFKRGEAPRDVRLAAARAAIAPRAHEQVSILILLTADGDPEIRDAAGETLRQIDPQALARFLARSDVPAAVREFFAARGVQPAAMAAESADDPLIDIGGDHPVPSPGRGAPPSPEEDQSERETALQQLAKMGFFERLKAAMKGSREIRAILVRDPNKMISAAVLSSPKLTEQEVEAIARMANVSEEVLRTIGANRTWMKNYSIVVGLAKNPKTPVAMSMNLMHRLSVRDLSQLSVDRNVPEALRIAARKKAQADTPKS